MTVGVCKLLTKKEVILHKMLAEIWRRNKGHIKKTVVETPEQPGPRLTPSYSYRAFG